MSPERATRRATCRQTAGNLRQPTKTSKPRTAGKKASQEMEGRSKEEGGGGRNLGLRVPGAPHRVPRRRGRAPGGRDGAYGAGDEAAVRDGVAVAEEVRHASAGEAPGGAAAAGRAGLPRRRRRREEREDGGAERARARAVGQAELRGSPAA